jgi:hypothetical protein
MVEAVQYTIARGVNIVAISLAVLDFVRHTMPFLTGRKIDSALFDPSGNIVVHLVPKNSAIPN